MKPAWSHVRLGRAMDCLERAGRTAGQVLTSIVEATLTRRPLMVGFLSLCALLSVSGWLRPPMSRDIRASQIPLLASGDAALTVETHSAGRTLIRSDSIAALVLSVIVIGIGLIASRPDRFPAVCGAVLSAVLVGNAAAAWNHPALIESLEYEIDAAARIRQVLLEYDERTLIQQATYARQLNAADDARRADLLVGLKHLQYGVWLAGLCACGVFVGASGGVMQRLLQLGRWTAVGVLLAVGLCAPRLRAEWHWRQSERAEQRGAFQQARFEAERAIAVCPQLGRLHRTWWFLGKLDQRAGEFTPRRQYFVLCQLASMGKSAQALPECLEACGSPTAGGPSPWTRLTCRLLCDEGIADYRGRRLSAAEAKWKQTAELMPARLDSPLLLAVVEAGTGRADPDRAAESLKPLLARVRDRALKAETWSLLGDLYFQQGQFQVARDCYRHSLNQFDLPKVINHRALKGLIGI